MAEPNAEQEQGQDYPSEGPGASMPERDSLLDQLADIRQDIKENAEPFDVAIPGYKEKLYARCLPFAVSRTEAKVMQQQRAIRKKQPMLLAASCDTIIDATQQLMLMNKEGKLIPIDEAIPVGWDQRLLELFKVQGAEHITNAREVVKAMFPTEQSIIKVSAEINEWLQGDLNEEADEEFLGNSGGTPQS